MSNGFNYEAPWYFSGGFIFAMVIIFWPAAIVLFFVRLYDKKCCSEEYYAELYRVEEERKEKEQQEAKRKEEQRQKSNMINRIDEAVNSYSSVTRYINCLASTWRTEALSYLKGKFVGVEANYQNLLKERYVSFSLIKLVEWAYESSVYWPAEQEKWMKRLSYVKEFKYCLDNRNVATNILSHKKYGERKAFEENRKYNIKQYSEAFKNLGSDQMEVSNLQEGIEQACEAMWYFAFSKPVDMQSYKTAVTLVNKYLSFEVRTESYQKNICIEPIEVLLSDIYLAGEFGDNVLNDKRGKIVQWLEFYIKKSDYQACYELASALKALHIYKLEAEVLRKIVSSGIAVGEDLQERIRFIENVGESYVEVHHVDTKKKSLQLDYSTLNWKEDDYVKFFKTLAYENMVLQYSLTIREWAKNLVAEGATGVILDVLFEKVADRVKNEYLTSVNCVQKEFELLSENSVETTKKGLLVVPDKGQVGFNHIALLLNVITFGRNLNLRIYTLFMPSEQDIERQKQQILSLKNNTSPDIVVFEEGIRATILNAIEDYINGAHANIAEGPVYSMEMKQEQQLF